MAGSIAILMYHNISPRPPEGLVPWLYVPPALFTSHMRILRRLGYRGLSMQQAMPYLQGRRSGRVVAITFDDGYVDNLDNALPVLVEFGFSATCYVVSDCIGTYNQWDATDIKARKPLMNAGQLRQWTGAGMEIGSHTCRHPRLTQCSNDALDRELRQSRGDIEQLLGGPVSHFCYPYGDVDARVAQAAGQAGYSSAVTVQRGRVRPRDDFMQLPRVRLAHYHGPLALAFKLLAPFEDRRH